MSDGSAYETYGDAGHDADDYDVAMSEIGAGNYYGYFDASDNIGEGDYYIIAFEQQGANPADTDIAIAQGHIYWDGDAEILIYELRSDLDALTTRVTALESGQTNIINSYDERSRDRRAEGTLGVSVFSSVRRGSGVYPSNDNLIPKRPREPVR